MVHSLEQTPHRRGAAPHRLPRLALASLCAVATLAASGAAAREASAGWFWKVPGAGFGHGVGMSQYGAYGFAKKGRGHKFILKHYYSGTGIGRVAKQKVRVLLLPYQSAVRFRSANKVCGRRIAEGKTYTARRRGSTIRVYNPKGRHIRNCGRVMKAFGGKSVFLARKGHYRGTMVARLSSVPGKLNAINNVPIEHYVRGVIAGEMPSSWPQRALRAQAVAARSYALATKVGGRGFDLYDDTRSQVYGGRKLERRSTNIAVNKTTRQVVRYKGRIATTYFFSTSGGETEHNENVWGGTPIPYLRSVKDPYDHHSPLHRWVKKFSRRAMQSRLNPYVKGVLRDIRVIRRGASPRIIRARLIGSKGKTTVSGTTLLIRLGLYDTWAFFKKKQF